jgi:riboflavin kinase / FMN adenylyltransferase
VEGEAVLISFHPHPRQIIGGGGAVPLLSTPNEKATLLAGLGIDHLVLAPFTAAFAAQSPEAYVEDFLISRFRPHTVIIGYDHRFGKGRQGDFRLLEDYAAKKAFQLVEIPQRLIHNVAVSSTRIRAALLEGDAEEAAELLGYPYFFSGTVVRGNQLGRTIGYPTANLALNGENKLAPAGGVYIVRVQLNGRDLQGMMNIGTRPTVDGSKTVIEVHILDFDEDIYDAILTVHLLKPIRKEQKFPSLEALKNQLAADKQQTRDYFQL